jgi:hypothetical protein
MDDTSLWRDLLVDTLGNEGPYESFVETPDGLKAYVQASQYDPQWLAAAVQAFPVPLRYKAAALEDKVAQTYDDQVAVWVEEAKPVYHLDRF